MCACNKEFQIVGPSFQVHSDDIAARIVDLVIQNIQQFKLFLHMSRNFPQFNSEKDLKRFEEEFHFQCTILSITSIEKLFDMYHSFFNELARSKKKFLEYTIGLLTPCSFTYPETDLERKYEPTVLDGNEEIIGSGRKVDIVCYSSDTGEIQPFHVEFIECKFNASNYLSFSDLSQETKDKLTYMQNLHRYFYGSKHCYIAFATLLQGEKTKAMLRCHNYDFIQVIDDRWLSEKIKGNM
jgi:hypothetical protein